MYWYTTFNRLIALVTVPFHLNLAIISLKETNSMKKNRGDPNVLSAKLRVLISADILQTQMLNVISSSIQSTIKNLLCQMFVL